MSELSRILLRTAIFPIVVAACSGTEPEHPEGCVGSVQVGVRSEPTPTFEWSPRCGISALTVTAVVGPADVPEDPVWGFHVPEESPLGPGVAYGEAPSRAHVWAGPETLDIGARYRVTVVYTVGGDVVSGGGEATFVWFPPD